MFNSKENPIPSEITVLGINAAVSEIEVLRSGDNDTTQLINGRRWIFKTSHKYGRLTWVRFSTDEGTPNEEAFQLGHIREPYPHADHISEGKVTNEEALEVSRLAVEVLRGNTG